MTPPFLQLNKGMDEIRKNSDRFSQREKTIDKDLNAITAEMTTFQREKQSRLNTITTVVALKASQLLAGLQPPQFRVPPGPDSPPGSLWYNDSTPVGKLPTSVEHCVVFTRSHLRALRSRIGELEIEANELDSSFKSLHKDERRLIMERKRLEGEIAASRSKCDDLQMLKFGRVIDVDALDRATNVSTTAATEVHASISAANAEYDTEIAEVRRRMAGHQEELLELTRKHTMLLETVATLTAKQNALEAQLSGKADLATDTTALASALGATHVLVGAGAQTTSGHHHKSRARANSTTSTNTSSNIKPLAGVLSSHGGGGPASVVSGAQSGAVKIGMINVAALTRSMASVGATRTHSTRKGAATGLSATMGGHSNVVVSDSATVARSDAAERSKLLDTVRSQAQQIEELRSEIAGLRRKGGVVHVPRVPAPLPPPSPSASTSHMHIPGTSLSALSFSGVTGTAAR
jgi:predicted  nucleic acid-binding Zn-ribbon protein